MKKCLVVDGNSILNRAFYGVRPLTTKDGFHTNALFGTVNIIGKQMERIKPDACAVAFDLKAPTFRHEMYREYKAGRKPMPEELAEQLPVCKELLSALGFTVLSKEGYEADDILGTLSAMCEDADRECYLLTGDRDSLQLISPKVHVLLATNTDTLDMDEDAFFAKYGVKSCQYVDVKALMGDASDHIPGVPGIGEKTAFKLIADYGSLEKVYEALPDAPLTPSVKTKLQNGFESAQMSQKLATICRCVPLNLELKDLKNGEPLKEPLRNLLLRLEFSGFLKKFGLDAEEPTAEAPACKVETLSLQKATALPKELGETVALDVTGEGTFLAGNGVCYSVTDGVGMLPELLQGRTVVCYDVKLMEKIFPVSFRSLQLFDLMLAGYLANSSKNRYDMPTLVQDYLQMMIPTAVPRVTTFLPLYQVLKGHLEKSNQISLLRDMEMPLAAVLADMETVGFQIDRKGILQYGEQLTALAQALDAQIYFHAGKVFNIQSPKQLGEILFDTLGLPHDKKTKTGYSTNAEILEKLRPYHPIIGDILDYRQVAKLKSTYVEGLLKVADENGRVHTTFKQTGTATGRLSSAEPNLQNIPVRTEMGKELRKYFLPKNENYVIIDADYSQIELRLLAAVSGDENLIQAFLSGTDVHTATAATVFGVPETAVTPEMRKRAKAVNFGIMYGIGAFSLSDDIGVSRAQAQKYIDGYLAGYPKVDAYLKKTIDEAYRDGYVTTLSGRRRYIPELAGKNKVLQKFGERVAMNSPIQGTAADLIKIAMIRVHQKLQESGIDAKLILQVHDELLIEAHRDCAEQAAAILKAEMEGAMSLAVPLSVEIHSGSNWLEAK